MIEKRLGQDEVIVIGKDNLFAFEESVNFSYWLEPNKLRSKKFLQVKGPGLIIFSTTNIETKKNLTERPIMFMMIMLVVLSLFLRVTYNLDDVQLNQFETLKENILKNHGK